MSASAPASQTAPVETLRGALSDAYGDTGADFDPTTVRLMLELSRVDPTASDLPTIAEASPQRGKERTLRVFLWRLLTRGMGPREGTRL